MPSVQERFLEKVEKTDTCWLWTGFVDAKGRGRFRFNGKSVSAHRVAYEIFVGEIPAGLKVCHTCDIPRCVRPKHLFLGTQKDNMADCKAKGRIRNQHSGKVVCINGHPLTDDNVYVKPNDGGRACKECVRNRSREYQRRKRRALQK